ncbi:uncharacterized protein L3040_004200 [Drepanopeziza brunnea f. sp. 'multigermtubi']|uniref:Uncharacterized protein n=1 Tax=Marssonina brunnea f. sp. multigermtubi (strain MB_m1) TaxID=1072389 RepID=K1X5V2_MARBU|nr:uncharacterized protein MBM_01194 [Drepanopeziza brunnea f. sp. 'multigermtubi' MB_m1]EKD20512.1 hypothetical protein MBM_01194 [Drepanopeziza brunnea f. sp. 'multigermtubi' MB_m1]KAJ5042807.1 hypothetical protein L3040_004200 [Drepanopeziza brunnea f. sp. 'multigermtubi']
MATPAWLKTMVDSSHYECPTPKLPNTSSWTWFCCVCRHANQKPDESRDYSTCIKCSHERCRSCSIRWRIRTIEEEWTSRAAEHTMKYASRLITREEYYDLKSGDEEYAKQTGLETAWMWAERRKREGKWGQGRTNGESERSDMSEVGEKSVVSVSEDGSVGAEREGGYDG